MGTYTVKPCKLETNAREYSVNSIVKIFKRFSGKSRKKRASMFRDSFLLDEHTKILDLGSGSGVNINEVLQGTLVRPENVYIADIRAAILEKGNELFGYVPVILNESEKLPFANGFFDIVYCSSVIEHVTVPKDQVWSICSGKEFRCESLIRQKEFANEIRRVGKQYFVQTPYKHFLIETHSWLPFIAWLPRMILVPVLKFTNMFWVKRTRPDWYLLNKQELSNMFDGANIVSEKVFGLTKSIMAIKSYKVARELTKL